LDLSETVVEYVLHILFIIDQIVFRNMITIPKAQVPSYFVGGEFCNALLEFRQIVVRELRARTGKLVV